MLRKTFSHLLRSDMIINNQKVLIQFMKSLFKLCLLSMMSFCALAFEPEPEEPELDEDGNPIVKADVAPSWSLKDAEGNDISSDSLKDKAYVMHFWATWCPYCKRLQPGLDTIAIGYAKKGIPTYAVSFWENPKARPVDEMIQRGLMLPVLVEGDVVAKSFGVFGTPTTIFVNKAGEITTVHTDSDPNDPQLRVAYETLLESMHD